tara:strand:+ start:459 stop:1133 length:675 start_codon:yes stop_codon:yes gene_type:complete
LLFFKKLQEKLNLKKRLLIFGTGGQSKVVTEIAESIGLRNIFYIDELSEIDKFLSRNVFKTVNENYEDYFFIAVGDNYKREKIYNDFLNNHKSAKSINLAHPYSFIARNVKIDDGTIIMPGSVINSSVKIGKGVIINSGTIVEHDSLIGDYASLAPGVVLGGNVNVGVRSAISIGSIIKHDINIGNDVLVGAASYVLNDLSDNSVCYGVPAKFIKKRKIGEKYL